MALKLAAAIGMNRKIYNPSVADILTHASDQRSVDLRELGDTLGEQKKARDAKEKEKKKSGYIDWGTTSNIDAHPKDAERFHKRIDEINSEIKAASEDKTKTKSQVEALKRQRLSEVAQDKMWYEDNWKAVGEQEIADKDARVGAEVAKDFLRGKRYGEVEKSNFADAQAPENPNWRPTENFGDDVYSATKPTVNEFGEVIPSKEYVSGTTTPNNKGVPKYKEPGVTYAGKDFFDMTREEQRAYSKEGLSRDLPKLRYDKTGTIDKALKGYFGPKYDVGDRVIQTRRPNPDKNGGLKYDINWDELNKDKLEFMHSINSPNEETQRFWNMLRKGAEGAADHRGLKGEERANYITEKVFGTAEELFNAQIRGSSADREKNQENAGNKNVSGGNGLQINFGGGKGKESNYTDETWSPSAIASTGYTGGQYEKGLAKFKKDNEYTFNKRTDFATLSREEENDYYKAQYEKSLSRPDPKNPSKTVKQGWIDAEAKKYKQYEGLPSVRFNDKDKPAQLIVDGLMSDYIPFNVIKSNDGDVVAYEAAEAIKIDEGFKKNPKKIVLITKDSPNAKDNFNSIQNQFGELGEYLKLKGASGKQGGKEVASGYGLRNDGTPKGKGFLGEIPTTDGTKKVMTEKSIGVKFDGKETQIPALVPTLSKAEISHLASGKKPTKEIVDKAVVHAKERMKNGLSPFYESPHKELDATQLDAIKNAKNESDYIRAVDNIYNGNTVNKGNYTLKRDGNNLVMTWIKDDASEVFSGNPYKKGDVVKIKIKNGNDKEAEKKQTDFQKKYNY